MADTAGHHGNVIDVSIRDHCFQSIFRVTRREFVLNMFVPAVRERFLGGRESFAGEITHKEFQRAQVCQLRCPGVVVLACGTGERMILIRVIVDRDERIRTEDCMNSFLRCRLAVLIFSGNVQHQRASKTPRFS